MRNSHFPLIFFFFCLLILPDNNEAKQADQLKRLLQSTKSSCYDSEMDSFSAENLPPVFVSPQDGKMEADRITELPGQPNAANFNQYSGYVTVNTKNGRALFYYFVEASQDSSTKPLLLWLNGGPGCSSLGVGALTEIGPFRVSREANTVYRNPFAWNNLANLLFLESPAGVGFSYSNTTSDYDQSGDRKTTDDSYTFLINWLERFPQYKTRNFFIAGESYAGHYIPDLAYTILQRNKFSNQTVINLRGIAIGNAYVDEVTNSIGNVDYWWSHALFSDETYAKIQTKCNFSSDTLSEECETVLSDAGNEIGNISVYNIYAPLCHDSQNSTGSNLVTAGFDPCTLEYAYSYLNSPAVQKALHADDTGSPKSWELCSTRLKWIDRPATMLPVINKLIYGNISFWLYSGDVDSVCPITDTRYFIKKLGLTMKTPWRPWYLNKEVGGYVEEYNGLTLATVREAGHEVPSYQQPARALAMISAFLQGTLPPST